MVGFSGRIRLVSGKISLTLKLRIRMDRLFTNFDRDLEVFAIEISEIRFQIRSSGTRIMLNPYFQSLREKLRISKTIVGFL